MAEPGYEVAPTMPTYEYVCAKCDQHLEVYQSFSEEPLKKHAGCGGKLTKVMGAVGIVLKGSGFYRTDNRAKTSAAKSGESKPAAPDSATSTPAAKSDSAPAKPEKKTEKKTA
jgi:putative FmdB family regulatory protein